MWRLVRLGLLLIVSSAAARSMRRPGLVVCRFAYYIMVGSSRQGVRLFHFGDLRRMLYSSDDASNGVDLHRPGQVIA